MIVDYNKDTVSANETFQLVKTPTDRSIIPVSVQKFDAGENNSAFGAKRCNAGENNTPFDAKRCIAGENNTAFGVKRFNAGENNSGGGEKRCDTGEKRDDLSVEGGSPDPLKRRFVGFGLRNALIYSKSV